MFKLPYAGIENSFTKNKLFSKEIIQEYNSNSELYGTQLTISFADRVSIFLANYPAIVEKIQSLVFQDVTHEGIIRKILISLLNKDFGSFESYELVKISIAAVISVTSRCRIDYPFEIIDAEFKQSSKSVKLILTPLITFLNQRSIILIFCSLSYIVEELHLNEVFQYKTEEIEDILVRLNKIEPSSLWNKEELIYQFLIRLNFLIDIVDDNTNSIKYSLLLYVLKSIFNEIEYFKEICHYFALNRWDILFTNKKIYNFSINYDPNNFLSTTRPYYPVFANLPNSGFRIVVGKARNIGFGTIAINKILFQLIEFLSLGDQIKLEYPFKTYLVQIVANLEGPFVQLTDKSCIRINSQKDLESHLSKIERILTLGDILLDPMDVPRSIHTNFIAQTHKEWVDEALIHLSGLNSEQIRYLMDLFDDITQSEEIFYTREYLKNSFNKNISKISAFISVELYKKFQIPIHPKWTPRWNEITNKEWRNFRSWIQKSRFWETESSDGKIHQIEGPIDNAIINTLKTGEIEFKVSNDKIIITSFGSVLYYLFLDKTNDLGEIEPAEALFNPVQFLNNSSKIFFFIEDKFRVNASLNSTNTYYLDSIREQINGFYVEPGSNDEKELIKSRMDEFEVNLDLENINFLKSPLREYESNKRQEILDKTILRAKHKLPIFKDGLIHFSVIDSPLKVFKPNEIEIPFELLKKFGYYYDIDGNLLTSGDQEVLLQANDIIIPKIISKDLLRVMEFINDELNFIYGQKDFYDLSKKEFSILGSHVIGINKNYSVGIYGRIIGFSSVSVCFASPMWHLSKGSYCNGEMTDSFVLDMDCFLNLDLSQIITKIGMFRGIPIFTQIEPDFEITSSILEKNLEISDLKRIFPNIIEETDKIDIINLLITNLTFNNNSSFKDNYRIENITFHNIENPLRGISDPIEKLDFFLSHNNLLGTITENEIFSLSIMDFLLNNILPDINNFFKVPYVCTNCGFKNHVIIDSKCINCRKTFELTENYLSIKMKLEVIDKFIQKFNNLTLTESTKDLLLFSKLQLKS